MSTYMKLVVGLVSNGLRGIPRIFSEFLVARKLNVRRTSSFRTHYELLAKFCVAIPLIPMLLAIP